MAFDRVASVTPATQDMPQLAPPAAGQPPPQQLSAPPPVGAVAWKPSQAPRGAVKRGSGGTVWIILGCLVLATIGTVLIVWATVLAPR